MHRLWIVAALIVSGACAPKHPVVVSTIDWDSSGRSWKGKTRNELVAKWGEPWKTQPDTKGGTMLIYRDVQDSTSAITPDFEGGFYVPGSLVPASPTPPPAGVEENTRAVFFVDENGSIYDYWISAELWKKGFPLPAPRRPPP